MVHARSAVGHMAHGRSEHERRQNPDREKTWRSKESTSTPRAMGVVEVSNLVASLLGMLGMLYALKTAGL